MSYFQVNLNTGADDLTLYLLPERQHGWLNSTPDIIVVEATVWLNSWLLIADTCFTLDVPCHSVMYLLYSYNLYGSSDKMNNDYWIQKDSLIRLLPSKKKIGKTSQYNKIQIDSVITHGRVFNGELYTQRLQKLIYLCLSTDCFMKISLHSSGSCFMKTSLHSSGSCFMKTSLHSSGPWWVERNLHHTICRRTQIN